VVGAGLSRRRPAVRAGARDRRRLTVLPATLGPLLRLSDDRLVEDLDLTDGETLERAGRLRP
jgi:hypothetical protein